MCPPFAQGGRCTTPTPPRRGWGSRGGVGTSKSSLTRPWLGFGGALATSWRLGGRLVARWPAGTTRARPSTSCPPTRPAPAPSGPVARARSSTMQSIWRLQTRRLRSGYGAALAMEHNWGFMGAGPRRFWRSKPRRNFCRTIPYEYQGYEYFEPSCPPKEHNHLSRIQSQSPCAQ